MGPRANSNNNNNNQSVPGSLFIVVMCLIMVFGRHSVERFGAYIIFIKVTPEGMVKRSLGRKRRRFAGAEVCDQTYRFRGHLAPWS